MQLTLLIPFCYEVLWNTSCFQLLFQAPFEFFVSALSICIVIWVCLNIGVLDIFVFSILSLIHKVSFHSPSLETKLTFFRDTYHICHQMFENICLILFCGYNVWNIFKEGPQNRNVAFRIKSIVWSINLNIMKHKLVYCSFLESASNGISFGIN